MSKNIAKIAGLILCLLYLNVLAFAGTTNSAVFLRIVSSARTAGIGGVGTAISGDVSNIEQNPASLYWVDKKQIVLAHNEWFEGIRSEYMAYSYPISESAVLAISGKYLYIDDMNRTDSSGNSTGKFSSNDSVYSLTFTKRFGYNFAVGANAKIIQQAIDTTSGSAFAGDIGFLYNTTGNMTFAGAIKNMGDKLAIYKEGFPLPLTYTFGVAYYVKHGFNLGLDIDQEVNCDPVYKAGFEYFLSQNIDLRLGYSLTSETYANPGITAGLGFNISQKLFIDYAYVPFGDLGDTHRFSLRYNF